MLLAADQDAAYIAPGEPGDRLDEIEPAFPPGQPARQHGDSKSIWDPPAQRELGNLLTPNPARVEAGEIDAARDRAQPVGLDPIGFSDMLADEVRDRDHPVAARHHRIVAVLERQIGVVGVMECRDEAPAGGARRRPGAPGRGPAARMHDVDPAAADELGESLGVAADHQRVFRGERQGDVPRADPRQFLFHRAAGRGDIGGPPGRNQRTGKIDGALLDAAGNQARNHLQYRRRTGFCRPGFFQNRGDAIVAEHVAAIPRNARARNQIGDSFRRPESSTP